MPQPASLFDALTSLIRSAETIDEDRKAALIRSIEKGGLTPELMEEVDGLFRNELRELDTDIAEKQQLIHGLEDTADRERWSIAADTQRVEEEYAKDAESIGDEFTAFCTAEERATGRDIETHKKKGETSEMDAIRTFLQKKV